MSIRSVKRPYLYVVIFLAFLFAIPRASLALRILEGTVVKVSDGDTIKVETHVQKAIKQAAGNA
ncbi:MAG TPA: hypothetical protein ENN18_08800 [Proteobacteria bacterium]|nr:hypothetical protein [Pseudomonadota bacterium]